MQFKNVIGQADVKQQLVQMVQHNRLSHALLFLGKEGSGALSLAMAFSQYLVCEQINGKIKPSQEPSLFGEASSPSLQPANSLDSCGVCSACIKANQLVHPDIHFSYPVVPKKPGDKPVSTDYIVEWRAFISSQPYGNVFDWLQ